MENDERDIPKPTADERNNVVQLPRDWLGPREDLVPFGPRARDADAPDPEPEPAYAADDFWGENSQSLHGVVRSPAPPPDDPAVASAGSGADSGPPQVAQPRRGRAVAVLALVVLALVAAAAIGQRLTGAGPAKTIRAQSPVKLLAGLASTDQAMAAQVRQFGRRRVAVEHPRRRHPAVVRHRRGSATQAPATAGSGGSVNVTVRATAATATASPASAATPSYTPAPPAASASGDSGAGGGGTSHSSSSNSQPPFGANGTLGPGSSPNG